MTKGSQKVIQIEILPAHLDSPFFQLRAVHVPHELVERVEVRDDTPVSLDAVDVRRYRTAQFSRLRFRNLVVLAFPQGQQQGFDTVLLLHVEHEIIRVERVEADRIFFGVREVNPVLPLGLLVYHLAKPLIGVTRIDKHYVRALLVILAHHVVHEEGFSATAGPQHEFVSVGRDSLFHRQVGNIHVQGLSREPVHHLDAERRRRVLVVRFLREETDRLFDKGIKGFLRRKIGGVARNTRPEQGRRVHRVVVRLALHEC